jgi:hypothetical protein
MRIAESTSLGGWFEQSQTNSLVCGGELFAPKIGGVSRFYHVKDGFTAKHTQGCSFRPKNLNHSGKVVAHDGNRGAPYFSTFILASKTGWPSDTHGILGISQPDYQPLHIRALMGLGNLPETGGLTLVFGVLDVRRMVGVILRNRREHAEHDDRQENLLHFGVVSGEQVIRFVSSASVTEHVGTRPRHPGPEGTRWSAENWNGTRHGYELRQAGEAVALAGVTSGHGTSFCAPRDVRKTQG